MMVLTVLGILVFSLVFQPPEIGGEIPDKPFHALAYTVLAFLFATARWPRRWQVWAWLAILSLSFMLEGIQHWLPGRTPSISDALANTVGVVLGGPVTVFGVNILRAIRRRFG